MEEPLVVPEDVPSSSKVDEPSEKKITADEVALHTAEKDCWLTIHGHVYDVSKYLVEHPGGLDVMMEHAGKDATEEFEYYGHSDKAREQMAEYLVGVSEGGDAAPVAAKAAATTTAKAPSQLMKILQALLPLLLVVAAFIIKSYADKSAVKAG